MINTDKKITSFGTWENTGCDHCGCEFLVTRTNEKTIEGDILCNDCEIYARAYEGGFKDGIKCANSLKPRIRYPIVVARIKGN